MLEVRYRYVRDLLGKLARRKLDDLARVLLEEETIDQDDLVRILGQREFFKNPLIYSGT